ncbi:hypothetical protein WN48_02929 [Eufriesea mexicana]|nr:hypothetical protein WN48_02929 [Eufriesea mexicana]
MKLLKIDHGHRFQEQRKTNRKYLFIWGKKQCRAHGAPLYMFIEPPLKNAHLL